MSKESSDELVGTVIGLPAAKKFAKYFEITIEKNRGAVFVGWMDATATLTFPEKDPLLSGIGNSIKSWAMDSYTGSIGHNNKWKKDYGTKLKGGDVIGTGYDPETGIIFFVVNGVNLGVAFNDIPKGLKLHPAVSMRYNDTRVRANFGAHFKPFKYDLTKLSEQLTHMGRNIQRQSTVSVVLNSEKYAPIALTNPEQLIREREVAALSERANLTQSQFCSLPEEVISTIFSNFKAIDLVQTFRVSRLWYRLASDNKVWRAVLHKQFNIQTNVPEENEGDSDEEEKKNISLPLTYHEEHHELMGIFKTRYNWLRGQYVSERSYKVGAGVNCLQFDDRYLVCGIDQEILVYDVNSGELLSPTIFHDANVLAIQFRDDNLVCGSSDGFVKLIDLSCGITKWRKKAHNGQTDTLHYLNNEILTGGWDGNLKVWDLESGKLRNNTPVHTDAVLCARFADVSGSTTVSSGNDKAFVLWSLNSNSIVTKFASENYAGSVNCIQTYLEDHTIVIGDENTVRMFDMRNTSTPWTTLKGPKSAVLSLQYDPKSGKIVTGGTNNRVTVWHAKTGSLYSIKMPGVVKGLQFDDKKLIVGGDYTHRVKQFNFEQGTRVLDEEELHDMRDYWLSRDN
jgi:hypothetical protein